MISRVVVFLLWSFTAVTVTYGQDAPVSRLDAVQ